MKLYKEEDLLKIRKSINIYRLIYILSIVFIFVCVALGLIFSSYYHKLLAMIICSIVNIVLFIVALYFSSKCSYYKHLHFEMINLLEYIHNKHIIHRDIKPDNFVMGRGNEKTMVYLIDFGLAKKFRSSKTLKHCPMTNKKKLTGTARYASVNALKGIEQSRRDDLESLGYVLLYFLKGNLPWQGLPIKNKEDRYTKIMEKKRDTSPAELCAGFPKQFEEYVKYTQGLEYEEDPKYDYLKGLFESTVQALGYNGIDRVFDWMVKISDSEKSKENCCGRQRTL